MYNEKYVFENLRSCIARVKEKVYTPVVDLSLEIYTSDEPLSFADKEKGAYRKIRVGEKWGNLFDCAWFHCTAKLPENAAGKKLVFVIDINGEGLVYNQEGCPFRGITNKNSVFDRAMGNPGKRIVPFTDAAAGGETVDFWMDAGCNDLTGNLQEDGRIREAYVAACDDTARTLFYDMTVLYVQAENSMPEDPIKYEILALLSECRRQLAAYSREEMLRCLEITQKRLSLKGGDSPALSLTAFGHAHIDLAWLWPLRETRRKGARTFATALELMGRYPEYRFGASQPQLYDWIKTDYPELYKKVKAAAASNRWELLGAVWAEPDLNLISGESVVRQILYGNAFWKKEFGKTTDFVWTPDTFGYSAALPQIFKKAGIRFFSTIKMSWNLINDFPYTNFRWRGIDGSEVIVHMPPEGNYLSEGTAKSVLKIKKKMYQNGQFGEALLPFGIGDGGGGPSPSHLEYLRREENLPGLCPIKQGRMADFFDRLAKRADGLPVWDGELYLERHLGVYTSAARNKKYNRLLELTLRDAEFLAAIASRKTGFTYPAGQLEKIWKEVLLYQFHDILPGSSIQCVYDECLERYEILYRQADEIRRGAAKALADGILGESGAGGTVIFNTLSFERDYALKTEQGTVRVTLPPMGYAVVDPRKAVPGESRMNRLENEYMRVTVDDDGSISGIYNKKLGQELLNGKSNLLYIYDDIENAWNLQYDYQNQRPERVPLTDSTLETDAGGAVLIQHYRYGNSGITLRISLSPGSQVLEITADADWHEKHKMLRIAFSSSVFSDTVSCETQFGTVTRSVKKNTTEEQAKIEITAHRWLSLRRPGLNFAMLNDCKYGYSVNGNVIELNALRGTDYPAKNLDFGKHTFRYGIYSDGEPDLTRVVRAGYAFNVPPVVIHSGDGAPETRHSYINIDADNVFIDGVKLAENGGGLVVRTYEAAGRPGRAALTFDGQNAWSLCNLVEEPGETVDGSAEYRPFEIISYYIK